MVYCVANNCDSNRKTHGLLYGFHRFPTKRPLLLAKWLRNMKMEGFEPTESDRLCSKHFTEDLVKYNERNIKLNLHAVPTLFDHSTPVVPKSRARARSSREGPSGKSKKPGPKGSKKHVAATSQKFHTYSQDSVPINGQPSTSKKKKASNFLRRRPFGSTRKRPQMPSFPRKDRGSSKNKTHKATPKLIRLHVRSSPKVEPSEEVNRNYKIDREENLDAENMSSADEETNQARSDDESSNLYYEEEESNESEEPRRVFVMENCNQYVNPASRDSPMTDRNIIELLNPIVKEASYGQRYSVEETSSGETTSVVQYLRGVKQVNEEQNMMDIIQRLREEIQRLREQIKNQKRQLTVKDDHISLLEKTCCEYRNILKKFSNQ